MASLFKPPSAPTLAPTPVMPTPDNQTILNAQKSAMAQAASQSGRNSTIIQPTVDKLGQ